MTDTTGGTKGNVTQSGEGGQAVGGSVTGNVGGTRNVGLTGGIGGTGHGGSSTDTKTTGGTKGNVQQSGKGGQAVGGSVTGNVGGTDNLGIGSQGGQCHCRCHGGGDMQTETKGGTGGNVTQSGTGGQAVGGSVTGNVGGTGNIGIGSGVGGGCCHCTGDSNLQTTTVGGTKGNVTQSGAGGQAVGGSVTGNVGGSDNKGF